MIPTPFKSRAEKDDESSKSLMWAESNGVTIIPCLLEISLASVVRSGNSSYNIGYKID